MLHAILPKTHKKYFTHPVTAASPFTVKTIDCVHQTGPRNAAYHPAVCYPMLDVYQVCHCVGRSVKNGTCSLSLVHSRSPILVESQKLILMNTNLPPILIAPFPKHSLR